MMTNENEIATRIRSRLVAGPQVLPELIEFAGCPVAELLETLRGLGRSGAVRASRVRRGQHATGPVWWHLPEHQAPRLRARAKPEPIAAAAPLTPAGGHEQPSPRAPQEIVERLGGSTTYREPRGSFGGSPALTADEIDFALATARNNDGIPHDRLARALAYAVATHSLRNWPHVQTYGVPHLLRLCGNSRTCRQLVLGEQRTRVRFVLWDAFHALVQQTAAPLDVRAKAARMREASYGLLYQLVSGELRALADVVMGDAVKTLRVDLLNAA